MASSPARIDELESLRGLAALPVVLFHLPRWHPLLEGRFVRNGYLMVDLFFVLSGFVICSAYAQRLRAPRDLARFQFLRLGRLYPVHLLFLAVFVAIEGLKWIAQARLGLDGGNGAAFHGNDVAALLRNLLLVQALVPDAPLTFNYPSWSISVEVATYALFGVVVLAATRIRLALEAVFATIAAAAFALLAVDLTGGLGPVLHGLAGFFLGALVARATAAASDRVRVPRWTATAIAAVLVGLVSFKVDRAWDAAVPLLTAALIAALRLSEDGGPVGRLLRTRPLLRLGAWSYAVYLSHAAIEWFANQAVRMTHAPLARTADGAWTPQLSMPATLAAIAAVMAAVLVVAAWVHSKVEAPWRARSRRFAESRWDNPETKKPANVAGSVPG